MVLSMKMERLKIMYRNLDIYEVEKILVNNYKNNKLELINRIIAYYHLSDYEYNRHDEKCFTCLYCSKYNIVENSILKICKILNISMSTLIRYRKRYIRLAGCVMRECEVVKN